jgi:tRNA-splicing ligase RtcB
MDVISDGKGKVAVYSWAPDLEVGALEQALRCAELPCVHERVAVMADGHLGYGVPIGAVLALDGHISPYAVGNDIGCGMGLVPTTLSREDILGELPTKSGKSGPVARDDIMGWVATSIPAGFSKHGSADAIPEADYHLRGAWVAMHIASDATGVPITTSQSTDPGKGVELDIDGWLERGRSQAGTLGSGNHFIELLVGPDGDVWLMLHSGSRGVGSVICNHFHRIALQWCAEQGIDLPDPGLAYVPVGTLDHPTIGNLYQVALDAGLGYAELNRRRMLTTVGEIVEKRFPGSIRWDEMVNIHHNDATLERHFGRDVWVHRKGAVKASAGTATITPGSMGTGSYLGVGLGNPESFESCSHGAGRRKGRKAAERELSLEAELATVREAGGKVFARSKEAVLDEMPGAYKPIDDVMAAQADLVATVRRFTPLGTYKGSDKRPKRKGGAAEPDARPEEER